ncbi:MAG: long-chain fatty acid--CoA ligase [Armatimonadetes bacterium]|nr:long-chain fatty acid--CoA ligase [Armatimonadota bacterium]
MEQNSLVAMFFRTGERHPEATAFAAKVDGKYQPISYADAAERVRRIAAALVKLGVQPGDRVALMSENRPEWALTDLGTLAAGAVLVPLYATLPSAQAEYILRDCGARVLCVGGKDRLKMARELRERIPTLEHLVAFDGETLPGEYCLETLAALGVDAEATAEAERRTAALTRETLATIVYTSGTTGEPKGAMLTHGNILANLEGADRVLHISERDVFLSFLPLSHIFERMAGYYLALRNGAAIYYAESIFSVARNLEEVRPTLMMSVPRLFENMQQRILETAAKAPPLQRRLFDWALSVAMARCRTRLEGGFVSPALTAQYRLADRLVLRRIRARAGGRIRYFVAGGAPLPKETAEFFLALGLTVLQGYGLTETSPVIAVNVPSDARPEGVGPSLYNVEVRVADDGEICARGPSIMKGYWGKPEETAAAIDPDGWFHTGDVGYLDDAGRLHITDRKKSILVLSTGKKVAPQPIEVRLKTSPYIAEAVLLGDQRSTVGALIVPRFDSLRARDGLARLTNAELAAHPEVRRLLRTEIDRLTEGAADYERIKRFAVLERDFTIELGELTPSLKPRRAVIMEHFAPQVMSVFGE